MGMEGPMARPIWKGVVTFGLLRIPPTSCGELASKRHFALLDEADLAAAVLEEARTSELLDFVGGDEITTVEVIDLNKVLSRSVEGARKRPRAGDAAPEDPGGARVSEEGGGGEFEWLSPKELYRWARVARAPGCSTTCRDRLIAAPCIIERPSQPSGRRRAW